MKPELLSLLSFAIGIGCRTISELQQHGKLRWIGKHTEFWGRNSWMRKYNYKGDMYRDVPPDNLYYRFFKLDYKERFLGSATFLVFLTDGMHLMQFLFFLFISLSVVPILGLTYGIAFWILSHVIHWILYRTLQR